MAPNCKYASIKRETKTTTSYLVIEASLESGLACLLG